MLCRCCANLDLDQIISENGYRHHASKEDLQISAGRGCQGCTAISSLEDSTNENHTSPTPENISTLCQTQMICSAIKGPKPDTIHGLRFWQPHLRGKSNHEDYLLKITSCFVEPGDELSKIIIGRPIARSSNFEEAFARAARWIQYCVENHPLCRPTSAPPPTRLVYVGSSTTEPYISLSQGQSMQWVTLSHCWGSSRRGITTESKIEARKRRLELTDLPILYQDAIQIVRKLGFQYAWIDSLCIIQDSNADWSTESVNMNAYYSGSSLNISAFGAADSTQGNFLTADRHRALRPSLVALPCISPIRHLSGTLHIPTPHDNSVPLHDNLSRRAWVLQETILSSRGLDYRTHQLTWRCNCMTAVECRQDDVLEELHPREEKAIFQIPVIQKSPTTVNIVETPRNQQSWDAGPEKALKWWYSTLQAYTNRKMSFREDRFPGIAGLAEEFSRRTGYNYICGMWREDIISGLSWTCCEFPKHVKFTYPAPSWSWASTNGLELNERLARDVQRLRDHVPGFDAEIIDIAVVNEGGDIYGRIESASLSLRGAWTYATRHSVMQLFHFNMEKGERGRYDRDWLGYAYDESPIIFEQIFCALDFEPQLRSQPGLDITGETVLFQLGKWVQWLRPQPSRTARTQYFVYCLLLEPVDSSEELYRRIGLAEVPENIWETMQCQTKTVKII